MYRKNPPNTGFTLVEILVVITIIGILMGLLLAAFGPVRRSSINFAITAEINELEGAVEQFKTKFGFFPPSEIGDLSNPDPVTNLAYAEFLGYLRRIAPNHSHNTAGPAPNDITRWYDQVGKNLDNDSILVFWLSGLNQNAQYPLTSYGPDMIYGSADDTPSIPASAFDGKNANETDPSFIPLYPPNYVPPPKQIFFEFEQARMEPVEDLNFPLQTTPLVMRYLQRKEFDFSPQPSRINPTCLLYFSSRFYSDLNPTIYGTFGGYGTSPSAAFAYRDLDHALPAAPIGYNPPISPLTYDPAFHEFFNSTSFQIIAPGVDRDFGGREFGMEIPIPIFPNTPDDLNWLSPPQYKFHRDNITNFTGGVLEKHLQ